MYRRLFLSQRAGALQRILDAMLPTSGGRGFSSLPGVTWSRYLIFSAHLYVICF